MTTDTQAPDTPAARFTSPAQKQYEEMMREKGTLPPAVRVVDIDMPMGSMISFMLKWAIASIPALIILSFAGALLFALLGAALR
jgi:hypothetical protein